MEDPCIDGRIILKWMLEKWDSGHGLDQCCSGLGQVAGCCEFGDELSGSVKCREFFYLVEDVFASQEGPQSVT